MVGGDDPLLQRVPNYVSAQLLLERGRPDALHRARQVHPHRPARRGPRHRGRPGGAARRPTSWSTTAGPRAPRAGVGIKVAIQQTPTVEDLAGSAFLVSSDDQQWLIATAPPVGSRAGPRLPLPDAGRRDAVPRRSATSSASAPPPPRSTRSGSTCSRSATPLEADSFGVTRDRRAGALRRRRAPTSPSTASATCCSPSTGQLLPPRRRGARSCSATSPAWSTTWSARRPSSSTTTCVATFDDPDYPGEWPTDAADRRRQRRALRRAAPGRRRRPGRQPRHQPDRCRRPGRRSSPGATRWTSSPAPGPTSCPGPTPPPTAARPT